MKDLREMKVDELKDIARSFGIVGAWKMTKDRLIECIITNDRGNNKNLYFDSNAATETHENEPESIETESHETNQEAQENEPETIVESSAHIAAKSNIKNAYDWIMGGHGNAIVDGEMTMDEFVEWLNGQAFDEILTEAMSSTYTGDSAGGKAPACMRKVTKEFCAKYLLSLFKEDNYEIDVEIKPAKKGHGAPKRGALLEYNGKEQNICAWGKELNISPNTLYGRIYKMGWTIEKAFTTPARAK